MTIALDRLEEAVLTAVRLRRMFTRRIMIRARRRAINDPRTLTATNEDVAMYRISL